MATINRFEDLETWKLAKSLADDVYAAYQSSPALKRDFKLWDQMNASSGSIMDNISEGFERNSRDEFINFLSYAKGSSGELKSQLYRAESRKYFSKMLFEDLYEKTDKVARKIGSHMAYLKTCNYRGIKFKDRTKIPPTKPKPNDTQSSERKENKKTGSSSSEGSSKQ